MSGRRFEPYEEINIGREMDGCVHFAGLMTITGPGEWEPVIACRAGVEYAKVKIPKDGGGFWFPCHKSRCGPSTCASAKFPSRDEAEAEWLAMKARLRARSDAIARSECPDHKIKITLRQVGACVYGSCGCRLYQGKLPKPARAAGEGK